MHLLILLFVFLVPTYASILISSTDASEELMMKSFCEGLKKAATLSKEENRKTTTKLTDFLCKESFLKDLKEAAPLKKCIEKTEVEKALETCGELTKMKTCGDVGKYVECQKGIVEKRCQNITDIAKKLIPFNQVAFAIFELKSDLATCAEITNDSGMEKYYFMPLLVLLMHFLF
ncbi:unnamed protein product, partial [Mesorhabditis belari]|uniref:Uncharacterized protein n=1 Tax=Mesorhabditis belari TaxID=2138241 RepID=A0AAF3J2P4_9BILA